MIMVDAFLIIWAAAVMYCGGIVLASMLDNLTVEMWFSCENCYGCAVFIKFCTILSGFVYVCY